LEYGQLSDYTRSAFNEQRFTVVRTGAEGDVTCYHTMHEGRCVGWAANDKGELQASYEAHKASLPDMFLLCENIHDSSDDDIDYGKSTPTGLALNDSRYNTVGSNPYNAEGSQDYEGTFNPCAHFVRDADKLKKIGDVRYNYMYWVGESQASSPLGYGPSAGDPETGETFWAIAYVYGAPTMTYGNYATDLVKLMNGEYTTQDVITGDYVKDFIERKGDPLPMDNSGHDHYAGLEIPDFDLVSQFGRYV
jgi:hypothetical protein